MIQKIKALIIQYQQIIKYIISGGTAAVVDILFLFIFTDFFHLWYLLSAVLAFLLAFGVSFGLQKYWTFSDKSNEGIHKQASLYFVVSIVNLLLNTLLMYIFVDLAHIWYMAAQVITGGLMAFLSYFLYKKFIFTRTS